jgi:septal ring factor EnvC (AmiA/AmiB activator)
MAEEAEDRRRNAVRTRQQQQRQFNTIQGRLRSLEGAQQRLRQNIEQSRNNINMVVSKKNRIQSLSNEALFYLLLSDQSETKLKKPELENLHISFYLKNLIGVNRRLNQEINSIRQINIAIESEFNRTLVLSRDEQSKLTDVSSTIKQIEDNISTYDRQRQEYQNRAAELERSAVALQNLINQLKADERNTRLTYTFAQGVEPPVKGRIITAFGPKKHERYNTSTYSNGVDIAVPENTLVRALSDGEVVFADTFTGQGRMIIIDHKNGFHSIYAYNNSLMVKRGDMVIKGQTIAQSGKTGSAEQPSLHFEIRRNGVAINPTEVIRLAP